MEEIIGKEEGSKELVPNPSKTLCLLLPLYFTLVRESALVTQRMGNLLHESYAGQCHSIRNIRFRLKMGTIGQWTFAFGSHLVSEH